MALSRWSNSIWYIYEEFSDDENDPVLNISMMGKTSLSKLIYNLEYEVMRLCELMGEISEFDKKKYFCI